MKLTAQQIQVLAEKILNQWKKQNLIVFKEDEKKVLARMIEIIKEDYDREAALDRDVNAMLDELEKSNPGEFQRFKMFPILKQKLAKERKVIL
ncbi:DUF507 family protein [Bdellovibrio sp. HCB337]|uniref:DUF507 family protein n=1 Tax=Bdellovibrio sp. HCB337 TaxID=3394358 RepID=UPI0039A50B20